MQIIRVYTGEDNESHFEELTYEQFESIVARTCEGSVNLIQRTTSLYPEFHNAPRRQYVMFLEGIFEFVTGDGTRKRCAAGDVLVAEDLTGHGHLSPSVNDGLRVSLSVPFSE